MSAQNVTCAFSADFSPRAKDVGSVGGLRSYCHKDFSARATGECSDCGLQLLPL